MVTADKGGHLAYLFKSNTCLNGTVTTFPATGQRPENDVVCAADSASSGR
ncbi:alpha/beta hydrolase [Nocardia aurea]